MVHEAGLDRTLRVQRNFETPRSDTTLKLVETTVNIRVSGLKIKANSIHCLNSKAKLGAQGEQCDRPPRDPPSPPQSA